MAVQLRDEDRRAVDLLLDRPHSNSSEHPPASAPVSAKKMRSAEKILNLLQQMPAIDPPADLAAKTLRRVDKALAALGAAPLQNVAQRDQIPPA